MTARDVVGCVLAGVALLLIAGSLVAFQLARSDAALDDDSEDQ